MSHDGKFEEMPAVAERLGIQEMKELVGFALALTQACVASLEDGKIGLGDALKFLGVLKKAGPAIKGMDRIPAEVGDLSEEERSELEAYVATEFNIKNDALEAAIEAAFAALLSLADLGKIFHPVS